MKRKHEKTLRQAMIITAATLMVCSFGCKETPEATPVEKVKPEAIVVEKVKPEATPVEKVNQEATKAGDSLNKTVKNASVKASEVATEAGDTINKTIETVSEKISDKISKEDK